MKFSLNILVCVAIFIHLSKFDIYFGNKLIIGTDILQCWKIGQPSNFY